jgi:hypothetical protein
LDDLLRHYRLAVAVFVAAETMQDDKCRPALGGFVIGRRVDETGDFNPLD